MDDMPVYLFTGFLESGKTSFIDETLADKRFNNGQRTLLLVCEEGEAEYDESRPYMKNIYVENIEDEDELTSETLDILAKKHRASRVLIEYNGMWQLKTLYDNMPENWAVYQEFMFADATTFLTYNANMRGLVVDKLSGCELVVFNRFTKDMDKMAFHKIVRGISRRPDIAYEYTNGDVEYDEIQDPLPFDINAPVVKIEDGDYALWYRDLSEDPKKYDGKVVEYKGLAAVNPRMKPGMFFFGRQLMTCCVEDIQFAGLLTLCDADKTPENGKWYTMRLFVAYKWHKLYGRKGPVLTLQNIEPAEAPAQPVATFY